MGARGPAPRGRRDDPDGPARAATRAPPRATRSRAASYTLPRPPSFNEPDITDKPSNITRPRAVDEPAADPASCSSTTRAARARCCAVDDHVKQLVKTLRETHQLKNTLIVFLSDNGWLQGEHRITGDKFLPYEESLRVPFILRGPGIPAGQTVHGQVSNIDFAPTLRRRGEGVAGPHHGRRLADADHPQPVEACPNRAIEIEALAPLFEGDIPINAWDRPYHGVRTDRYTYVVYTETGDAGALRPPGGPVRAQQRRGRPRLRGGQGRPRGASWRSSTTARAAPATSSHSRARPSGGVGTDA